MNLLDRTIGFFSPSAGLKRAQARQAMGVVTRAYDGAATGRRASGWTSSNAGPNSEVRNGLSRLRARSSEIIRNTPAGAKAIRTIANNSVGPKGLTGESKAKSKALRRQIDDAWNIWIAGQSDLRGRLPFGGQQRLAVRGMAERGDCLIRRIDLPSNSGRIVPLALQMLEGDFLDLTKYAWKDNPVIQGVELDKDSGAPVAYWIWNRHPGELFAGTAAQGFFSTRVPAADIIHLYEEDRIGQVRGVPRFASIIATMRDLGDYDAAEIVRQKIAACLMGFIHSGQALNAGPLVGLQNPASGDTTDANGNISETFEPGMLTRLLPGEDITFSTPPASAGIKDFHGIYDRQVAAGIGVMYEQLTGDLSNVNYSSFRAGHLEFRTDMECLRADVIVPACNRVRQWFIDAAVIAGVVTRPDYSTDWTAPAWQSVDPMKDAFADRMDVRSGFMSLRGKIAERGGNFDTLTAEVAADNAVLDQLDLVLDTDPRRVLITTTGKGQPKPVDQIDTEEADGTAASTDKTGD